MSKKTAFAFAFCAFLAALFSGGKIQAVFLAAALFSLGLKDAGSLRAGSFRFWIFPALFAALSPFFIGEKNSAIAGMAYSTAQLKTGGIFLLHAYGFSALAVFAARNFSTGEVVAFGEKIGLKTLGLRIALAAAAARILRRTVLETWQTYRLGRPQLKKVFSDSGVLAGAMARNTALAAENIAVLLHIRNVKI